MRRSWALPVFLAACAAYWAALIWIQSGIVEGKRYFVLFDDAMVSMRYAANLVRGMGLVFNPGERVEGFTNPLWVAVMALVHLVVKDRAVTSLAVQVISAVLLLGTVVETGKLALLVSGGDRFVRWASMFLCATFYPLNFWALHGMEVGALAWLATVAVRRAVEAAAAREFSPVPAIVLAVAMLVRADALVLALAVVGASALVSPGGRVRGVAIGVAAVAASAGLQTALRLAYYGDVVPNTYYLKMSGIAPLLRACYGLRVLGQFAQSVCFVPVLLPLVGPLLRRSRLLVPALAAIGAQVAYSVWVGGDSWETPAIGANRFLSSVAPVGLVLIVLCCRDGVAWFVDNLRPQPAFLARARPLLAGACVLVAGVLANGATYAAHVRLMLALEPDRDAVGGLNFVRRALVLERMTAPTARVAVTNAGTVPYFLDRYIVDILGKVDPHIAHEPMHTITLADAWWPGHMKYDQAYSIGVLKPDVVAGHWHDEIVGQRLLARDYRWDPVLRAYVRLDSAQALR